MKFDFKKYLMTKLKIISFFFALIGWLILFIFVFGQLFEKQLITLTEIMQTQIFIWGLRIIIISLVIFMARSKIIVPKLLENKKIKSALKIIYAGGIIGWILFIISLFI